MGTFAVNVQGPTPKVGELVAVRFTGSYKGQVFDDLFKTAEPLYFRAGVGTVVPVRISPDIMMSII